MVAQGKGHNENQGVRGGVFRMAATAAVLGVALSGCSSVPDAVNPVKWYEQTTDFFSGDNQAAQTASADGQNQGLSADPDAPPPAPAPQVSDVQGSQGGLSADQASSNYASPPIERQGAPVDVLRPQTETAAAPQPPAPSAAPTAPVTAMPAPSAPMDMASAPPPQPVVPGSTPMAQASERDMAAAMPERPTALSMEGAPPPPTFNMPANAVSPFGGDEFETVVIGADGMETMSAPRPQLRQAAPQQMAGTSGAQARGAMFPEPGATTSGQAPMPAPAGMTRVATIHFANNAANLDQRDRSILDAVVQLQRERGGRVVVVGHASARTMDMDYIRHQMVNFEVSMQRAATVGDVLKGLGLPDNSLEVQAVSDSEPLYLEVMPSGEAGNRRVEIYLAS